jgi:hypothetical protein
MSLWSWIRNLLGEEPAVDRSPPPGAQQVQSGREEDVGGERDASAPDSHSTTGTTPNETFVGRPGGDDPGYLETGAEKRAAEEGDDSDTER